jgi:bacteriocin biosynthesis cyclodehydratase domain-containing protein
MSRPRLRSQYLPVRVPGNGAGAGGEYLVVVGETRSLLISDPAAAELAPTLDGTREVAEVVESLLPRHTRRAGASALRRHSALDLLADGEATVPVTEAAAWDALGVDPDRAAHWLRHGHIAFYGADTPVGELFGSSLQRLGPRLHRHPLDDLSELDTGNAPVVVATESLLDPRLRDLNAACLAANRPWTLVRPLGTVVFLGPHFVPGETGCWECLRQRLAENEQLENFLAYQLPRERRVCAARATLPTTVTAVAALLANELPGLVQHGRSPRLTGHLLTVDTVTLSLTSHTLVRQPQCPACGDPDLLVATRVVVRGGAAPARTGPDGGTRVAPAAATYQRLAHHISRYLGVVTRLTSLEPEDNGLRYTYSAGHNFALARQPGTLKANLRGQSGGKGRTDLQARVSALGEAIERYCGVWRGDRPTSRASYRDLDPRQAVHPRQLLGFSDSQYAHRDELNATLSHFHHVPRPLPDDVSLQWTAGWSLTHDAPRDIPAAYCWYGHPELATLDVCSADSNGCAAGSSTAEAVLQGFCELVERDSVALWWYHRSRLPGVDLDSFHDPWLDGLREHYASDLNRELWALDLTADLGIPTFAAISPVLDGPAPDVLVGFGAHFDPRVALGRAVAEVNQFLPAVMPGPDGRTRYGISEPDTLRWFTTVRPAGQPWLRPATDQPPTTVDTHRSAASGDVATDARRCVELAERAGLEVIVVDQSRPDIELNVVKVIVPGLRHFWRRLGPGRLWQVPARLGRSPLAADEHAVNPLNVFF